MKNTAPLAKDDDEDDKTGKRVQKVMMPLPLLQHSLHSSRLVTVMMWQKEAHVTPVMMRKMIMTPKSQAKSQMHPAISQKI